jgi:hypothetical protein
VGPVSMQAPLVEVLDVAYGGLGKLEPGSGWKIDRSK